MCCYRIESHLKVKPEIKIEGLTNSDINQIKFILSNEIITEKLASSIDPENENKSCLKYTNPNSKILIL